MQESPATNWVESLKVWTEEKTNSRLLIVYLIVFQVFNWKITSTLWFEESSVISIPKVQYINNNLLLSDIWYWNVAWHFITPFLLALILIVILPLFTRFALIFRLKQHFDAKNDFDKAEAAFEKQKTQVLDVIREEKEKQGVTLEVIREEKEKQDVALDNIFKNKTNEERWKEEIGSVSEFTLKNLKSTLNPLLYKFRGSTSTYSRVVGKDFDSEVLSTSHVLGLIDFNQESDVVSLTDKGKFVFASLIR